MAKYKNLTEVYGDGYMLDPEYSDKPFKPDMGVGASEYVGPNPSKAGAGRGKQGGPTAKELKKYEDKLNANIFTEGKRMPPSPREMASGGKVSSASKRADGCATKGKTKGTMITMKGGGYAC
jgi:hypothetical protein